jgi:hypothetical protein
MSGTTEALPQAASPVAALSRGGCCGYRVDSHLPFGCLRPGPGIPLTVAEAERAGPAGDRITSWPAQPEYPHTVTLSKDGPTYTMLIDDLGWFQVDPAAASILMSRSPEPMRREVGLWGIPAALCAIHRGQVALHAAAVEVAGSAILLAAPGHFGKTTLAAAFLRAGHGVLGEDFMFCHVGPAPDVLPGPAVLRLRSDVFDRIKIPGTSPAFKSMGRVYLALDQDRRGDSRAVPLRAIVFLRPAPGPVRLGRVPMREALRDLWSLSFMLPTDEDRARCFRSLGGMVATVPAWNLYRPLEFGMLDRTVEAVASLCLPL